jgi:hypothetical protein
MIDYKADVLQSAEASPSRDPLAQSYDLLQKLLKENDGTVSSVQFKHELMSRLGLPEPVARECMREMQFLDAETAGRIGCRGAKTYHRGRSFFSKEKHEEILAKTAEEAASKEQDAEEAPALREEPEREAARSRREEARLGAYVKAALEIIYGSDFVPEGAAYVFDVHRERPGSTYENVDIIAVHWRSEEKFDLVTVEVKLEFSAKAIHQACNYTRFSNRVWIASAVSSDVTEAALKLRSRDPGLFDYTIARGIGILACRRSRGRSYEVFPIHWPTWHFPQPVELDSFIERYRPLLENEGVVEQRRKRAARS